MDKVYVVRWGPAAGDDYSTQVFTTKARMLAFVKKLKEAQTSFEASEDAEEIRYEVHYVTLNAEPSVITDDIAEEDLITYSELICFSEGPDSEIWRTGTEVHQS